MPVEINAVNNRKKTDAKVEEKKTLGQISVLFLVLGLSPSS